MYDASVVNLCQCDIHLVNPSVSLCSHHACSVYPNILLYFVFTLIIIKKK